MTVRRRNRGFERVGAASLGRGSLPARRERELRLGQAWRSIAGEAVAERATARRVARGVLELEIADRRWADAIAPVLAGLAARLAERHPGLGVRRYRVRVAGAEQAEPARPLGSPETLPAAAGQGSDPAPGTTARKAGRTRRAAPALEDLARRYLLRRDR